VVNELIQAKSQMKESTIISLFGWVCLFAFPTFSYVIQTLASYNVNRVLIYVLIVSNLLLLLLYPICLSFFAQTDPIIAGCFVIHSVTIWLKLLIFHHVMHDVRGLVRRVIKAKNAETNIHLNKFEDTILGVN